MRGRPLGGDCFSLRAVTTLARFDRRLTLVRLVTFDAIRVPMRQLVLVTIGTIVRWFGF